MPDLQPINSTFPVDPASNSAPTSGPYDAVLIVSFGGPEQRDDVMPFLENVTRGRGIPRERLLGVAEHYYHFGGKSPINDQNRALIAALEPEITGKLGLPIYWGNRNWHPMLADTVRKMADDRVRHAVAFVTSAFGSYSGCRQYRGDIAKAREQVGDGAPAITQIRPFAGHPKFLEAMTARVREALDRLPGAPLVFTAHSVPQSMADTSPYVQDLEAASAAVATSVGSTDWKLVYQSRSGPPTQPWLEPDVCDHLRETAPKLKETGVILVPIGFLSDHMEVLYDLDTEASDVAKELGIRMVRAGTAGTHPAMIEMITELVQQPHQMCPADCCPVPKRPPMRPGQDGPPPARPAP